MPRKPSQLPPILHEVAQVLPTLRILPKPCRIAQVLPMPHKTVQLPSIAAPSMRKHTP